MKKLFDCYFSDIVCRSLGKLDGQFSIIFNNNINTIVFIVLTPTLVGREILYTRKAFFVQSNLIDLYIHGRELCVVSLERTGILEYGIKKILFSNFFLKWSYQGLKFCEYSTVFIHFFSNFC